MKAHNNKCLVLNADYSLLRIVDYKKAMLWHLKYSDTDYGVEIIDFYEDDYIIGTNNTYPIPAVAKIKKYFNMTNFNVSFSKKNIFIRDDYTCQYCGLKKTLNELTYDHVIPKSKWKKELGSATSWTNITTACISCNRKKGGRTPQQANMPMLSIPHKPVKNSKYLPVMFHLSKIDREVPKEWKTYIPENCIYAEQLTCP